jgi:hypothetical protein
VLEVCVDKKDRSWIPRRCRRSHTKSVQMIPSSCYARNAAYNERTSQSRALYRYWLVVDLINLAFAISEPRLPIQRMYMYLCLTMTRTYAS